MLNRLWVLAYKNTSALHHCICWGCDWLFPDGGESSSLTHSLSLLQSPWAIYHLKIMRLANEKKRERIRNENVSGAYRYETKKSLYVREVCVIFKHQELRCIAWQASLRSTEMVLGLITSVIKKYIKTFF